VAVDASSSFRWAASTQIFAAISEQRTGLVLTGLAREHSFDHWKDSYYFVQMKHGVKGQRDLVKMADLVELDFGHF
jgi:hypothetical protein